MKLVNFLPLILLSLSFFLTLVSIPFFRKYAFKKSILDRPGGHKEHDKHIPLLGGVAIWLCFSVSVFLALGTVVLLEKFGLLGSILPALGLWVREITRDLPEILAIITGATALVVLGLLDDLVKNGLHYRTKFIVQFLAAGMIVATGLYIHLFPWTWLNMLVSFLWIVGITNTFNLLDGMDGLAAGVAAISATGFLLLTLFQIPLYAMLFLVTIIGCCVGFLRYNFNPAKIFMGDAGSLMLGFLLACVAIISENSASSLADGVPVLLPLLVLSLPIYDTFSVIVIRLRERRHLFVGDNKHFFHRLADMGVSKKNTVFLIYSLNLFAILAASSLFFLNWFGGVLMAGLTVAVYTFVPKAISLFVPKAAPAHSLSIELAEPKRLVFGKDSPLVSEIESDFDPRYFDEAEESYVSDDVKTVLTTD